MTTNEQDRAIAEALGWKEELYPSACKVWQHPTHAAPPSWGLPRLTANTTLGRAMCYDAIVWLGKEARYTALCGQCWEVRDMYYGEVLARGDTLPAALRAAMIQELGI